MCATSEFPPDKHAVAITTTICAPDVTEETTECTSKRLPQYSNTKTDKDKKPDYLKHPNYTSVSTNLVMLWLYNCKHTKNQSSIKNSYIKTKKVNTTKHKEKLI